VLIVLLAGLSMPRLAVRCSNGRDTEIRCEPDGQTQCAGGATITKFYIAEADPGSGYETGPLHILYGDGTQVT